MPDEFLALIDKPHLLALVLACGAAIGIAVERFAENMNRPERRAYWRGCNSAGPKVANVRTARPDTAKPDTATATVAEQLRRVMEASFKARPLLNKPEKRLIAVIDKALGG